jgi:hypothetical protein
MFGNIDVVPPLNTAPERHAQDAARGAGSPSHLHADCNLADSANRKCSPHHRKESASGTLDFSTPVTSASNALQPEASKEQKPGASTGKAGDGASRLNDVPKTEDEYMKIAPALERSAYKMPKDASSKQLVDAIVGNEADAFLHAPKDNQKAFLKLLNVDKQTQDKILANDKHSANALTHLLVKQERAFLDIPPTLKAEDAYKAIEKGIEHNQYQAMADIKKLHDEMSKP